MKGSASFHFLLPIIIITILEKEFFCIFVYYEEISTNKFLKIYGQKIANINYL